MLPKTEERLERLAQQEREMPGSTLDTDRYMVAGATLVECVMAYGKAANVRIEQVEHYLTFKIFAAGLDDPLLASCWIRRGEVMIEPTSIDFPVQPDDEVQLHSLIC